MSADVREYRYAAEAESEAEDAATEERRRRHVDWQFMILTVLLLVIGLVILFSASFANSYFDYNDAGYVFKNQLTWAVIGVIAMMFATTVRVSSLRRAPGTVRGLAKVRYLSYRRMAAAMLYVSIILLFLTITPLPIAAARNGAKRWLNLVAFQFQPSEVVKIGLILAFAKMLCDDRRNLRLGRVKRAPGERIRKAGFTRSVLPFGIILAVIIIILALQPHFSAAIIICAIAVIMLFTGGLDERVMAAGIILAAVGVVAVIVYIEKSYAAAMLKMEQEIADGANRQVALQNFRAALGDFHFARIVSWLHPEADPSGGSYQINQSLYAIGSGGLLGVGLGQSRQKVSYLPEEHNDYIFSVYCEELGFIGAILLIFIFALLIIRGFWIAMHAKDKFSSLVVIGIMGMFAVQVFFNIGVVTNLLPSTGISLPFFSYGGTALMIQLFEMGIVLSASRDMKLTRKG
ncbi:MAG: FtsW/RodA/SpoVE family cell cycle protein [Oscillospiraceae bacterium]|jgi:cell division protein FtsW|nr:FtsW/RodA/SpoVE family cell cycle protein [Oscillospiraceae bacterium]